MSKFDHLWNDLPYSERDRLYPHMIETHILHVKQSQEMAISAHKKHMKETNDLLRNLEKALLKHVNIGE